MKKYIMNPFKEGDLVTCINSNFPCIITTSSDKTNIGKKSKNQPLLNKNYRVFEILGEYLRFSELDCNDETSSDYSIKWWKSTHFKKSSEIYKNKEIKSLLNEINNN